MDFFQGLIVFIVSVLFGAGLINAINAVATGAQSIALEIGKLRQAVEAGVARARTEE